QATPGQADDDSSSKSCLFILIFVLVLIGFYILTFKYQKAYYEMLLKPYFQDNPEIKKEGHIQPWPDKP
ncbi:MAG: hypothetical protein LBE80_03630, partial [Deltaproteobacteria bacterium]|nr:hypothetical protein [Deltaproteobacteria bacterium]